MADPRPAPSAQAPARSLHLLDLPRDILNLIFARLLPCELFAPRFTCRSIASLPAVSAAERRKAVKDCWTLLLSDVRSLSFLRWFCETLRLPKSCNVLPVVAGTGCLDLCKWVSDEGRIKLGPMDVDLREAILAAALSGSSEIIQWLFELVTPSHAGWRTCLEAAFEAALEGGHTDLAKWVRSMDATHKLSAYVAPQIAARKGDLASLRWLVEEEGFKCRDILGSCGTLAVYEYLLARGVVPTVQDLHFALRRGHMEVVTRLVTLLPDQVTATVAESAAHHSLDRLKFVHSKGAPLSEPLYEIVSRYSVEALQWLHDMNCPAYRNRQPRLHALCAGRVDCLKWLHEHGFKFGSPSQLPFGVPDVACLRYYFDCARSDDPTVTLGPNAIRKLAHGNHLGILQWAVKELGVAIPPSCLGVAVSNGRLTTLRKMLELGCRPTPMVRRRIEAAASRRQKCFALIAAVPDAVES